MGLHMDELVVTRQLIRIADAFDRIANAVEACAAIEKARLLRSEQDRDAAKEATAT